MREDMARVIVERPRLLDSIGRKGRLKLFEDCPKQLGMRRSQRERGGYKMLNENLAPLRRFLERQVGRPWDKVYSEIAARLRVDSTVQQHVRDHLLDFVAIRPQKGISDWRRWRTEGLWYQPLYVDRQDGLLKRTDHLPEARIRRRRDAEDKNEKPAIERIELGSDRELRRIGGIWYEVALATLPLPEYRLVTEVRKMPLKRFHPTSPIVEMEVMTRRLVTQGFIDVVSGQSIPVGPPVDEEEAWREYLRRYLNRRYAVRKRQLSKRELRRHGITNSSEE